MRFGFHVSIQGGLHRAPERAHELGCDCLQIFSGSPRSWDTKPLAAEEIRLFREGMSRYGLRPCVIHAPYLLNLSAEDGKLLKRSREALLAELRRGELIGADYVVVHMGSRKSNTECAALDLMARSVQWVLERFGSTGGQTGARSAGSEPAAARPGSDAAGPGGADSVAAAGPGVTLLLENTSGGGGKLGYCFRHLAAVLEKAEAAGRVGICLDTAHLFQAGYKIHTRRGLRQAIREFTACISPEKLFLLHLNDSLTALGSGHDRHWHIGRGCIGRRGFKRILHKPVFSRLPAIMETPKKTPEDDGFNLRTARMLARPGLVMRMLKQITQFSCNKTAKNGL